MNEIAIPELEGMERGLDHDMTGHSAIPVPKDKTGKNNEGVVLPCQKEMLAILGTAGSLPMAPFAAPDWEIWAVAQCQTYPVWKRSDILFELHTPGYWKDPGITERIRKFDGPVYMQDHYKEIPNSVKFPLEVVKPYRKYHTTSITYMLALAYHSFVTTQKPSSVSLFGVHMSSREEYTEQRPCCEYWLGRMEGAGMSIDLAPGGSILGSDGLYGYEGYNPICMEIKKRIDGLTAGANMYGQQKVDADANRNQQLGAVKEAEFWLRQFQTGNVDKGIIGSTG